MHEQKETVVWNPFESTDTGYQVLLYQIGIISICQSEK